MIMILYKYQVFNIYEYLLIFQSVKLGIDSQYLLKNVSFFYVKFCDIAIFFLTVDFESF